MLLSDEELDSLEMDVMCLTTQTQPTRELLTSLQELFPWIRAMMRELERLRAERVLGDSK